MTSDPRTALASASIEVLGEAVPAIGFGTWQLQGEDCRTGVREAIALGYRHIDTAQMYENEREVGQGIRDAGVDRDELLVVTKIAPENLRPEDVHRSVGESLDRLRLEMIDLVLIHWPNEDVPLEETLGAMDRLREAGKIRRIGVSNFTPSLFDEACGITEIFCNQVEYHPFLDQDHLLESVRDRGRLLTAYSPLARGRVDEEATIVNIARDHDRTPAQVTLRWLLQQRVAAIPKASSPDHRKQNIDILDFELDDSEMEAISALKADERIIDPPEYRPDWERPSG